MNDEYFEQLDADDWYEYVSSCVEIGYLHCGREVDWCDMVDYHCCVFCE